MKKRNAAFVISLLLLSVFVAPALFSQDEEGLRPQIAIEGDKINPAAAPDELAAKIKEAKDPADAMAACEAAIGQCASYEDYERVVSDIKKFISRQKDYKYADVLYYAVGKGRVEELSFLTRKNDIDSGRVYMSVSEKYYNEALENLERADQSTKSKDLVIDTCLLRFLIFKELFQPQKIDAAFSDMISKISSYSADTGTNLAKLNEISQKLSDKKMTDYAMKLKLVYASKADRPSAQRIADEIKLNADKLFGEGKTKEALAVYDSYLQVAENYYGQDELASKLMEIAEKYFNKGRYKEAIKYYSLYLFKYGDSQIADYASYKLALSLYNSRDYAAAMTKFEEFLNAYQNSVWFEKAFEGLARLYYEKLDMPKAVEGLQKLIDAYPRHDTRDYAHLLTGVLYYGRGEYDKALASLRRIENEFPASAYLYTAGELIHDINGIKKGHAPSYSFDSKDSYKTWETYMPVNAEIAAGEGASLIENKDAKPGEIFISAKPGSKIIFTLSGLEDMDRFSEYWQDKDDQSRLPRKTRDQTEKDLLFFTWSGVNAGKFLDDKQTLSRAWQAPQDSGNYDITVNVGDLGLIHAPDSGSRKDDLKVITIHVTVEK